MRQAHQEVDDRQKRRRTLAINSDGGRFERDYENRSEGKDGGESLHPEQKERVEGHKRSLV